MATDGDSRGPTGPAFVPRSLALLESRATRLAGRLLAPGRTLAGAALRLADRIVGTWAGAAAVRPREVGVADDRGSTPLAHAARQKPSLSLVRPWWADELDAEAEAAALTRAPAAQRGAAVERTLLAPVAPAPLAPAALAPARLQRTIADVATQHLSWVAAALSTPTVTQSPADVVEPPTFAAQPLPLLAAAPPSTPAVVPTLLGVPATVVAPGASGAMAQPTAPAMPATARVLRLAADVALPLVTLPALGRSESFASARPGLRAWDDVSPASVVAFAQATSLTAPELPSGVQPPARAAAPARTFVAVAAPASAQPPSIAPPATAPSAAPAPPPVAPVAVASAVPASDGAPLSTGAPSALPRLAAAAPAAPLPLSLPLSLPLPPSLPLPLPLATSRPGALAARAAAWTMREGSVLNTTMRALGLSLAPAPAPERVFVAPAPTGASRPAPTGATRVGPLDAPPSRASAPQAARSPAAAEPAAARPAALRQEMPSLVLEPARRTPSPAAAPKSPAPAASLPGAVAARSEQLAASLSQNLSLAAERFAPARNSEGDQIAPEAGPGFAPHFVGTVIAVHSSGEPRAAAAEPRGAIAQARGAAAEPRAAAEPGLAPPSSRTAPPSAARRGAPPAPVFVDPFPAAAADPAAAASWPLVAAVRRGDRADLATGRADRAADPLVDRFDTPVGPASRAQRAGVAASRELVDSVDTAAGGDRTAAAAPAVIARPLVGLPAAAGPRAAASGERRPFAPLFQPRLALLSSASPSAPAQPGEPQPVVEGVGGGASPRARAATATPVLSGAGAAFAEPARPAGAPSSRALFAELLDAPRPVVSAAPSSDAAQRMVAATQRPDAHAGDGRVSLGDLTVIAMASATQQLAASEHGAALAASPAAAAEPEPAAHADEQAAAAEPDVEGIAQRVYQRLERLFQIARERNGDHG